MKLENQVTSLELSQRLKELGVKQESFAYWVTSEKGETYIVTEDGEYLFQKDYLPSCSAFTVAELGEMLTWGVEVDGKVEALYIYKDSADQWNFLPRHGAWYKCFNDTEADARAKMLVYLIENKLITL